MKTKFTIPSKFRPSFKGKVYIIIILFFSPFICVFINYSTSLYLGDLYTFGILDRKDFFTVWIALFGAIGIAINIYQNQKRTVNQDRQLENQNKQLQNQEEQLKEQEKQIELQSKSQRDSRFSKGIELLGNDNESARAGAAYSLYFLAKDYPDEFSKPVFEILCSHIRTLTTSEEYLKKHPTVSNEVQTILDLLFKNQSLLDWESEENFDEERIRDTLFSKFSANLQHSNLQGADLMTANLYNAKLFRTNLAGAELIGAYLEMAVLSKTIFSGASSLAIANLKGAYLGSINLRGVNLEGAILEGATLIHLKEVDLSLVDLEGVIISSSMRPSLEQSSIDLSGVIWIDDEERKKNN